MTLTKSIAMAVIVAALGVGGSQTQAQDSRSQPAEFPPSSYKGKQYVDSAGCVFIRAGIDGDVSWVPRMSRARQQICGLEAWHTAMEVTGFSAHAFCQLF